MDFRFILGLMPLLAWPALTVAGETHWEQRIESERRLVFGEPVLHREQRRC